MTDTALVRDSFGVADKVHISTPEHEKFITSENGLDIEPIEIREESGGDALLDALDIDDDLMNMPEEDRENHKEVKQYILDIIKKSGDSPTMGAFKRTLNDIKADMGLPEGADPSMILDRISGVVRSWKSLSFIHSPSEKKSILSKLMRATDSKDMNRIVLEQMESKMIWR
jgi:hypothetical protein